MRKKHMFMISALAMTAFIFWNSLKPAQESSEASGRFVTILGNLLTNFGLYADYGLMEKIVRKTAHIAEFGVQAILFAGCFSGKYRKRVIYILFFGLLTACTDEYIQLFSAGRAGLISDIFIDFSGTSFGTVICGITKTRKRQGLRR